ncbi:MAG: hypothetical protein EB084_02665 [Proteobacteria bacterium]|nr:hypothetical protein [Pseudomonadota bacterium]
MKPRPWFLQVRVDQAVEIIDVRVDHVRGVVQQGERFWVASGIGQRAIDLAFEQVSATHLVEGVLAVGLISQRAIVAPFIDDVARRSDVAVVMVGVGQADALSNETGQMLVHVVRPSEVGVVAHKQVVASIEGVVDIEAENEVVEIGVDDADLGGKGRHNVARDEREIGSVHLVAVDHEQPGLRIAGQVGP